MFSRRLNFTSAKQTLPSVKDAKNQVLSLPLTRCKNTKGAEQGSTVFHLWKLESSHQCPLRTGSLKVFFQAGKWGKTWRRTHTKGKAVRHEGWGRFAHGVCGQCSAEKRAVALLPMTFIWWANKLGLQQAGLGMLRLAFQSANQVWERILGKESHS